MLIWKLTVGPDVSKELENKHNSFLKNEISENLRKYHLYLSSILKNNSKPGIKCLSRELPNKVNLGLDSCWSIKGLDEQNTKILGDSISQDIKEIKNSPDALLLESNNQKLKPNK